MDKARADREMEEVLAAVERHVPDVDRASLGKFFEGLEESPFYASLLAIIVRHFPDVSSDKASILAVMLAIEFLDCIPEGWSPRGEVERLTKIRRHLSMLARLYKELPKPLQDELSTNASRHWAEVSGPEKARQVLEWGLPLEYAAVVLLQDEVGNKLPEALFFVPAYMGAIEEVIRRAEFGKPEWNRQTRAWRLVEAAARLCRRCPGVVQVPKALNPTSPFNCLLEELFDVFRLKQDTVSAFRAWRKHVDSNAPNS